MIEELMKVAEDRGISVRRVYAPICVHGGEPYAMQAVHTVNTIDVLDGWEAGTTLLLYKVFMRQDDELITVRFAKGAGEPHPEDC